MTASGKYLIVNADDFGLSPGANQGIIEAHEHGIVTSTSLMVRWPSAVAAAAYGRAHPQLSVGLHLDLGEWTFANDEWQRAYEVVSVEDRDAVAQEVARQLKVFRDLMGRDPSHLDSHQHVHRTEPVLSVAISTARELGVVLRDTTRTVRYSGEFYGQSNKGYPYPEGISVEALLKVLRSLPAGCTELGCHPGTDSDMEGMYRQERALERQTLCDPRVREAIHAEGITLCCFLDWRPQGLVSLTR